MARPKIYNEPRVATAIRLPATIRADLQTAATARDVSVNLLVTRAVTEYLRRLPPLPRDEPETRRPRAQRREVAAS